MPKLFIATFKCLSLSKVSRDVQVASQEPLGFLVLSGASSTSRASRWLQPLFSASAWRSGSVAVVPLASSHPVEARREARPYRKARTYRVDRPPVLTAPSRAAGRRGSL